MKNILLITDVDFWNEGAGHRMRILALITFLSKSHNLTVLYLGDLPVQPLGELGIKLRFINVSNNVVDNKNFHNRAIATLFEKYGFELCIIEFIHLSYCLRAIPKETIKVLDAHDIISERSADFMKFNYPIWGYEISKELEYKIFGLYDSVMVICEPDYCKLKSEAPNLHVLLCPHPVDAIQNPLRFKVTNVAFIASEYTPNVDAIRHFLTNIWSKLPIKPAFELNIYGNIVHQLKDVNDPNVRMVGFVKDLSEVYRQTDIIINPVRFGAGLKIKNVEAIANGIPLITTVHGARGLEQGCGTAFILAQNDDEFLFSLLELVDDFDRRMILSTGAIDFAKKQFSAESCFSELMKVTIDQLKV